MGGLGNGVGARRAEFLGKERVNMKRNGEIEIGGKGGFGSDEGHKCGKAVAEWEWPPPTPTLKREKYFNKL